MDENIKTIGLTILAVVGIGFVFVLFWLIQYMFAYVSKISKKRVIVRRNGIITGTHSPDDFDRMTKEMKEAPNAIANQMMSIADKTINVFKQKNINRVIENTTKDKIEKLKSLQELQDGGIITPEEFQTLKDEILSKKLVENKIDLEELENEDNRKQEIIPNTITPNKVVTINLSDLDPNRNHRIFSNINPNKDLVTNFMANWHDKTNGSNNTIFDSNKSQKDDLYRPWESK